MLDGRVVVITGDRFGLAAHLAAAGAVVSSLSAPFVPPADVAAAFADVAATHGRIDVVVHAHFPPSLLATRRLADLIERDWARSEALLAAALFVCQAAFTHMREHGGRIILVTPTAGLVGEAGFTPIATATEGMRSLAKAAARQWGEHGITVNCVAPSLELLGAALPRSVNPPALGHAATVADLARTIVMFAGDTAAAVTGATIPVDGGVTMLP
jgi:NAD(P)-dependent dehydrogenase (short-subunit alcohol dehydrogenase family)